MAKRTFALTIGCILFTMTHAQLPIRQRIGKPQKPDSTDISYYNKKNSLRAISIGAGYNIALGSYNRYIGKKEYAYITLTSIKANLGHQFVWDNDQMGTNMFLHPYQGNIYYTAARANGYGFWKSGLYSLAGSAMWEWCMETEYPSMNDIIVTPIGGMALGEVFHRASDLILNDKTTGPERFGRELAAFIVAPSRGLTRILTGDAWKTRTTTGKQFGLPEAYIDLSAGVRVLELKDKVLDKGIGFTTLFNLEYGDRFDSYEGEPYNYFTLQAGLNIQASQPVLGQLNIMGRIWGNEWVNNKKRQIGWGIFQYVDYYDSDILSGVSHKTPYRFCAPAAAGPGLVYRSKRLDNWGLNAYWYIKGIAMGAALSDYYSVRNRNYNLGSGYGTKAAYNFIYKKDRFAMSLFYEMYHLYTWKGYPSDIEWTTVNDRYLDAQGDISNAILHVAGSRWDVKLIDRVYLTAIFSNYTRQTNYTYYDKVFSQTSEGRLMLTYKF